MSRKRDWADAAWDYVFCAVVSGLIGAGLYAIATWPVAG